MCSLADKTQVNQTTIKFIGVIRHLLASKVLCVLQYYWKFQECTLPTGEYSLTLQKANAIVFSTAMVNAIICWIPSLLMLSLTGFKSTVWIWVFLLIWGRSLGYKPDSCPLQLSTLCPIYWGLCQINFSVIFCPLPWQDLENEKIIMIESSTTECWIMLCEVFSQKL